MMNTLLIFCLPLSRSTTKVMLYKEDKGDERRQGRRVVFSCTLPLTSPYITINLLLSQYLPPLLSNLSVFISSPPCRRPLMTWLLKQLMA